MFPSVVEVDEGKVGLRSGSGYRNACYYKFSQETRCYEQIDHPDHVLKAVRAAWTCGKISHQHHKKPIDLLPETHVAATETENSSAGRS